ncbi:MFS transporter [Verrucomicrobiales bacterium BCK34]|nr:MFS transporter [Verrucomicrobiales bacterium BCK34]
MEKKLYELVTDDDDGVDLSVGIGSEAAEHVPVNFGRQVIASVASKTGDQFSKPGLILTWLLTALGAPAITIGLLVPIREAGSLLPQLVVANFIRRREIRKNFWVIGSALQGVAALGMGLVALTLEGPAAGWSVVGLLVLFSLARGVCSISSKDLLGKTIPKTRRGRLGGLASSISGWIAVGVAVFFIFNKAQELPASLFAGLLFAAGILWFLGAFVMARVIEKPGEVSAGAGFVQEMKESLGLVKSDPVFLKFCIARALLASTVLSMPFYVVLAHDATGGRIRSLGILMIAGSLATALSGVIWGKSSDASSRKTLAIAGLAAGLIGCLTALVSTFEIGESGAGWLYGSLFFLIGLAHTGIRNGRKTYLIDHATQDNRARLVAVSNTLMGITLLLSGSFGLLAGALGERAIILIFAILGIAGSLLAFTLPEAERT